MGCLGLAVLFRVLTDDVRVSWNGAWHFAGGLFPGRSLPGGLAGGSGGWVGSGESRVGLGKLGHQQLKSYNSLTERGNQSLRGPLPPSAASESREIICSLAEAVHGLAPSSWLGEGTAVPARP